MTTAQWGVLIVGPCFDRLFCKERLRCAWGRLAPACNDRSELFVKPNGLAMLETNDLLAQTCPRLHPAESVWAALPCSSELWSHEFERTDLDQGRLTGSAR